MNLSKPIVEAINSYERIVVEVDLSEPLALCVVNTFAKYFNTRVVNMKTLEDAKLAEGIYNENRAMMGYEI